MTGPYRLTGPAPDEDVELVPGDPALPDAEPEPAPEPEPLAEEDDEDDEPEDDGK